MVEVSGADKYAKRAEVYGCRGVCQRWQNHLSADEYAKRAEFSECG